MARRNARQNGCRPNIGRQTLGDRQRRVGVGGPTLDEYFEGWIVRKRATARKAATPYRYNGWYRNHIRQPLGGKRLREIQVADVQNLQMRMLEDGYSTSSVNYTVRILKLILGDAQREDLIERNPARQVRGLPQTEARATDTNHRALTEEEQTLFLEEARHSFYYEFFCFLLLTGLRHGEAAAMTWADVDWEANLLRVRRTLTFDEEGHIAVGDPKSEAGRRDIPMNESIRQTLRMQRLKSRAALDLLSFQEIDEERRIFFPHPHPEGILHNATANKALGRILDQIEARGETIERFSLHALRDTFATRFIEQGGTAQTLKTILGHRSLAITMDLYSQVLPNTRQEEMDGMEIPV